MKKQVLVTGGAGYIGGHVVRQLTEAGYDVTVFDNLSTGSAQALIHGEKLIVGDLADTKALDEVIKSKKFKTILHFAAAIIAPESVSLPLKYYSNNTKNTLNLLQASVENRVENFIFSSTAAVYGIPQNGVAGEESPTTPINPYGTSKLMSEWMLRDVAFAHAIRHVALRYFNVAGADPLCRMGQRTINATHLIKVCCQAALGLRKSVEIFGTDYETTDGTGVRDYIHIEDLASAHLSALEYLHKGNVSNTFNVGYGTGSSVRQVIEMVKNVSGVDFCVEESPRRPGDPANLVAKADKIRSTGWLPRFNSLETIVRDAWHWEQKMTA